MVACQIQRCNKFRLDNLLAVQSAMLLLSCCMERGGTGEEKYKCKLSHKAITDIVYNDAADEGENKGVGLSVLDECTYCCCSGLSEEKTHCIHLLKREVKVTGPTENLIKLCITQTVPTYY